MKKNLFLLGAAIVALSSCTQDEVLNMNESRMISFESFVNKGTRAVTQTNDLTQFHVFGYYLGDNPATDDVEAADFVNGVFNNTPVEKNGEGKWKYNGGVHTPWTTNQYYFAAYATKNASGDLAAKAAFADQQLTITNYTVTDEEDLVATVVAKKNSTLTDNTVDLNFKHLLSQVYFELTNDSKEDLVLEVTDFTINVNQTGACVYDGTTATWVGSNPAAIAFEGVDDLAKGGVHTTKKHLVIPGQATETGVPAVANITTTFTVNFYNNETPRELIYTKLCENIPLTVADAWAPGYIYKYTAAISPVMPTIEFSATVEAWEETEVEKTL